jgi:RNA polymerase sigma factor (sigma-70 family)
VSDGSQTVGTTLVGDADLVALCRSGDRDAFVQIVERYQSLLCSIAYSATGDLKLSEDLAQETFLIAWRQLRQIREPERLRSWLCAVARSAVSNWFRRQRRQPTTGAEPIEAAHEKSATDPIPSQRAIRREEETILWDTLKQIPDAYREPLILFYREGDSVQRVAAALDISENAAKQRLSRGRRLLQDKVLALVEGGLRQSAPGKGFTIGVMGALSGAAVISAEAAPAYAAVAKAGTAKGVGVGGLWTTLFAFAPIALVGGWIGRLMVRDGNRSQEQAKWLGWVWRMFLGAFLFVTPIFVLLMASERHLVQFLFRAFHSREQALSVLAVWFASTYIVVFGALGFWLWRRRRKSVGQEHMGSTGLKRTPWVRWVLPAMVAASVLLGAMFSDSNWGVSKLSADQVLEMAAKQSHAEFFVEQWRNGSQRLVITVVEAGKRLKFEGPVEDATLALLSTRGIPYPIYVEGKDFGVFGWPGNLLPFLCVFILGAGVVLLLRHPKVATQKLIMKAITAGIIGAALAFACVGTALALRHHREQALANQADPFQMVKLSDEENAHYASMSPDQAAQAFFEACGRGDWHEVDKFCAGITPLDQHFKEWMTGVTVVSLGKSFTRPGFAATFVPYEIRFQSGDVKKWNLAIRRDNPQGRWMFDGGL